MIKVKFFAMLKQILGVAETELPYQPGMKVSTLIAALDSKYPHFAETLEETKSHVAVNYEFSGLENELKDNDEVAFIPPMSGGSELIKVQKEDFSVDAWLQKVKGKTKNIGGIALFLGTARSFSRGRSIKIIEFEHYPVMAEKQLERIREEALKKFNLLEVAIVHRVGPIQVGENIVLIIAAAEHRREAFAACRWCIDELKQITPIWKKEITTEGDFWVEEHP